jgi:hypothetical protein
MLTKTVKLTVVFLSFCLPVIAYAKPCEALKSEIDAKLKEKGVQNYTLEIVPKDAQAENKTVVGQCDGGQNKILYKRGN